MLLVKSTAARPKGPHPDVLRPKKLGCADTEPHFPMDACAGEQGLPGARGKWCCRPARSARPPRQQRWVCMCVRVPCSLPASTLGASPGRAASTGWAHACRQQGKAAGNAFRLASCLLVSVKHVQVRRAPKAHVVKLVLRALLVHLDSGGHKANQDEVSCCSRPRIDVCFICYQCSRQQC
jgi:hypothetical protein